MPNYFSDLKNVYKRTYEELKNPKSAIGVFLERLDEYEVLDKAKDIKTAVQEYIQIFEKEKDNFKEPDIFEGRVSYKREQQRLRKNLQVEERLAEAVRKMNDALDVFAQATMNSGEKESNLMASHKEKLRIQRDRVLNAAYSLEVDLENRMIEKLKKEYRVFEHRPMESQVKTPPFVKESAHYKIRHMELKGSTKVPTALYGLMRFRDLLNDHESIIEEAERSRQYEKFVNDRLAGFQAWKNTLKIEQDVFDEISKAVDTEYFEKYNEFMEQYTGTSCVAGYQTWYAETYKNIQKMEDEIKQFENEQEQLDKAYIQSEEELKELEEEYELEEKNLDTKIQELEEDPLLSPIFYENNEKSRIQTEKELNDLEEELKNMDAEINLLDEEQNAAKETMLKNVQWIQNYSNELNQLKEAMESDAGKILQDFLEKHEAVAQQLDETLHKKLEELGVMARTVGVHNENIEKAEKGIEIYTKEVNDFKAQIDEVTKKYEEEKEKAAKDLKAQKTIGKFFVRTFNIGGKGEESKEELKAAEDQKDMVEVYGEKIKQLQSHVKTSEEALLKEQENLATYKQGWKKIHEELKVKIKDNYEYTTEVQVKLSQLEAEKQEVTIEYEEQVKGVQKDSEEQKKVFTNILDKTSSEFDKLKEQKKLKGIERTQLLDKIKAVQEKITECKNNSANIQNAKDKKEELLKLKEKLPAEKEAKIGEIDKERELNRYRCAHAKTQLAEKRLAYDITIKSHKQMKKFYLEGKVTSNRVLKDLNAALAETMQIASRESRNQLEYIKGKEVKLMESYAETMNNSSLFAERVMANEASKEEKKDIKVKAGVYDYMKKLSSMKKFNSKSFENLKKAIMKQYSENGELRLGQIAVDDKNGIKHEDNVKAVRENLKQIADSAKAYIQEKGSASRFTKAGKERYRFADEMRTMAETMLCKFELMDKEKEMANKLMYMDDKELFVSKQLSFYKTTSYDMAKNAFVKNGEVDKMNMMNFGRELAGEKEKTEKEEPVLDGEGELEMH